MTYQFHTSEDHSGVQGPGQKRLKLSMLLFQRSLDVGLGAAFNCAASAALLSMVAQQVDMVPSELVWVGGDVHLYLNHMEMARTLISREPRPFPKLRLIRRPDSIDGYRIDDFEVTGYEPHASIEAPVAV
jgi:thymidylate synthase